MFGVGPYGTVLVSDDAIKRVEIKCMKDMEERPGRVAAIGVTVYIYFGERPVNSLSGYVLEEVRAFGAGNDKFDEVYAGM